jgi:vitamin-K-epoxide reductase (warfarin-sensitive)
MAAASLLIYAAATAGVAVSLYALYVERHAKDDGFVALCDLSPTVSCSDVLTSEFSHVLSYWRLVAPGSALDVPNAALGVLFYLGALSHALLPRAAVLGAATLSVALSLYLAYVLAFVLHDTCVLCISTYVLNFLIFMGAARRALAPAAAARAKAGKAA